MSQNHVSEVAYFRHKLALQEEAARQGLAGFAITTRHDFITARMQQGGNRILQLIEEGKTDEAFALWDTQAWEGDESVEREEQAEEHKETWQEEREGDEPAKRAH